MNIINYIFNFHEYLFPFIQSMGHWTYLILFVLIFMETGLVIFPFLPGESLIFFTASIAAKSSALDIKLLLPTFFIAAVIGDIVNYEIGRNLTKLNFFKRHIPKTKLISGQRFFNRHGGKTVIFGRFIPLIRTFVPLISGTMSMEYKKFFIYNIIGVFVWVCIGGFMGYFFGSITFVQEHFSQIFIAIAVICLIPSTIIAIINLIRRKIATQHLG